MDVLDELEHCCSLILGLNLEPELFVDYKPVLITYSYYRYIFKNKRTKCMIKIDNFPFILDRPWTPKNFMAWVKNGRLLIVYNGFIKALFDTLANSRKLLIIRRDNYYDFFEVNESYINCSTSNDKNMMQAYSIQGETVDVIRTRFGFYNIDNGNLHRDMDNVDNDKYHTIVENYTLDKPYYGINGMAISGIYSGVLNGKVPVGYEDYFPDPDNPRIVATDRKSGVSMDLIELGEQYEKKPAFPHIKSLADLVQSYKTMGDIIYK